MKRIITIVFVFLSLVFAMQTVFGQEVSDTLQYKSSLTLGGSYSTGLLNQTIIKGSFKNMFKKSNWALVNKTSYVYSTVNGDKVLDDWTVISKLNYLIKKQVRIYPTLLHLYTSNRLFRVNNSNRYLVGAGISPLDNDNIFFLAGVGFEHTSYGEEVFRNSDLVNSKRNFGMTTIYFENAHHFANKKFALKYTAFYIQSFEEAKDYTFWLTPSLNVALSKKISFAVSYDFRYRNVHLIELPPINQSLTFNISASFNN